MSLRIPVTASNIAEWVRRAANAVNALLAANLPDRVTVLETGETALDTRTTALESHDTTQDGRITTLETFAASPFTVNSITLTPISLPTSPVKGMTVYDVADDKLKTWDGANWQPHW